MCCKLPYNIPPVASENKEYLVKVTSDYIAASAVMDGG